MPSAALLGIEVAVTTAEMDRAKAAIYAIAGISQYLLVQPERKQVVVFENGSDWSYTTARTLSNAESLLLPDFWSAELNLSELFPE